MKMPHLFHRWEIVEDTGFTVYRQCCVCGTREIHQPGFIWRQGEKPFNYGGGHGVSPVDGGWLKTGEWTPDPPPPCNWNPPIQKALARRMN